MLNLIACGISHKTSSLEVRERCAMSVERQQAFLSDLLAKAYCSEAILLNTCNRSELYAITQDLDKTLEQWYTACELSSEESPQLTYLHKGENALRHLMMVASGMDSMIVGEPQIFGQLKTAVAQAKELGAVGSRLDCLFQQVFATTKKIRNGTAIGKYPVSVANTAVSLAKCIYADLSRLKVLLIGAGETIEAVAWHLQKNGVREMCVANRQEERAHKLQAKFHIHSTHSLTEVPELLCQADIVISATASEVPILTANMLNQALSIKRVRPMYLIDLAVPRDIEFEVGKLEGVYLYNVDDLQALATENKEKRQKAMLHAQHIIDQAIEQNFKKIAAKEQHDLIKQMRSQAETIKQDEITKALGLIQSGYATNDVLHRLAHNLTNKLLHEPTQYIKQLSQEQIKLLLSPVVAED